MRTTDSESSAQDATQSVNPSLLALVKVVAYKRFILLVRYPLNTAIRFVTMFVFFAVVFFGGQAIAGPAFNDSLDGIIVGFFLFTLAVIAYSGLSADITQEAQWGTLERLFMSPHRIGTVMAVKTAVNVCMSFVWAGTLLLVMMVTTQRWLFVDPLTVIPLAGITLLSVVGVGFLLGGLALLYKRIDNIFQLVQFGFVGLIAAPIDEYEALKLLPMAHGSYLTRVAMENNTRLWEFQSSELLLLVGVSVVYVIGGFYFFHRAQRKAREEGLLEQY